MAPHGHGHGHHHHAAVDDHAVSGDTNDTAPQQLGLRIAAIFVILITSLVGTLFPIVSRRVRWMKVHELVYSFMRYFGSGVIIATAFIHLLHEAFEELDNDVLSATWGAYPWAAAMAMTSVFAMFLVELIAHRTGVAYIRKKGLTIAAATLQNESPSERLTHGHSHTSHGLHLSKGASASPTSTEGKVDEVMIDSASHPIESEETSDMDVNSIKSTIPSSIATDDLVIDDSAMTKLITLAILEFGIIFHSMIIGLTLGAAKGFTTLFVVIVFHQMFEGLGLGSRLALLRLPVKYRWVAPGGAIVYSIITPLGVAIGLACRSAYDPYSQTASIVAGTLNSLSAGILLYTGFVELLAHDFIFNKEMAEEASNMKVAFAVGSLFAGAAVMALLGIWA